jgi:hypothetical protein
MLFILYTIYCMLYTLCTISCVLYYIYPVYYTLCKRYDVYCRHCVKYAPYALPVLLNHQHIKPPPINILKGFFINLEPMAGALEALKAMEREGLELYICTSPIKSSRFCAQVGFLLYYYAISIFLYYHSAILLSFYLTHLTHLPIFYLITYTAIPHYPTTLSLRRSWTGSGSTWARSGWTGDL